MSVCRRIAYVLLLAAVATPVRADTPPAPPLDMREYQAFANRPPGDSTAAINMKIHTKLVGSYAGISSAFVTVGTAYGRWQVGAYCDYVLGEASSPPRIDKGLYAANDVAQFGVDSDSVLRLHNLRVGTYLMYAAAEIASATAEDAFQQVPTLDENGGTATASIPTLKFSNPRTERICVTGEIVVRAPSSHLTLEPTSAGDVILK